MATTIKSKKTEKVIFGPKRKPKKHKQRGYWAKRNGKKVWVRGSTHIKKY